MRKRKDRKGETQKTVILTTQRNGEEGGEDEERVEECNNDKVNNTKFHACYLLTSLCPRFKGHTYIGYTVNPRRRIRQHNGEIGCGAWRTKSKRPWEMVLCIYGFPTNVAALQFEWAWQHPVESLAVRSTAASFKSLSGLANKIKLAYTMLTLPSWQSLNLTVNLFSTKYQTHTSKCPTLPEQMRIQVCSMNELPLYNKCHSDEDNEVHGDEDHGFAESTVSDFLVNQGGLQEQNCTESDQEDYEYCDLRTRLEKTANEEVKNSREEDYRQSFRVDDNIHSPVRASSSSFVTSPHDAISDYVEDRHFQIESTATTLIADTEQEYSTKNCSGFGQNVEVIDVFTPSPCCTKISKKRRKANGYPDIIDLTNSPIFV